MVDWMFSGVSSFREASQLDDDVLPTQTAAFLSFWQQQTACYWLLQKEYELEIEYRGRRVWFESEELYRPSAFVCYLSTLPSKVGKLHQPGQVEVRVCTNQRLCLPSSL
jgi:hypothetical protein